MSFSPNLIGFCSANGLSDVPGKSLNSVYHLMRVSFHFTSCGMEVVLK